MSTAKDKIQVRDAEVLAPQSMSIEGVLMRAVESGANIETLERLMTIRREIKAEQAQEAFYTSLSQFQADCPIIKKAKAVHNTQAKGGGLRYHYAPLDLIMKTVSPLLQKHGLSVTMKASVELEPDEAFLSVSCEVHHIAGHTETSVFKLPIDKDAYMNAAQKFGSASTYAKRYAFCNALGILTGDEDNDGGKVTPAEARQAVSQPRAKASTARAERATIYPAAQGEGIDSSTIKVATNKMEKAGLSSADFEKRFGFVGIENVKKSDINVILSWIGDPVQN